MAELRLLVVNADDFGLSDGVNAGIAAAHERGVVTSTSLMVRRAAASAASGLARRLPALAVGLHIDLGQWDYVEGEWKVDYQRCAPGDAEAIERECRDQLAAFRELLGRDPTHLDSHQHTHMSEPVAAIASAIAAELGVPLRGQRIRYEGGFYGQSGRGEPYPEGIEVEALLRLLRALPPGWTELGCHPGIGVTAEESSYCAERERELQTLCDERVRSALEVEGIELRSFAQYG